MAFFDETTVVSGRYKRKIRDCEYDDNIKAGPWNMNKESTQPGREYPPISRGLIWSDRRYGGLEFRFELLLAIPPFCFRKRG